MRYENVKKQLECYPGSTRLLLERNRLERRAGLRTQADDDLERQQTATLLAEVAKVANECQLAKLMRRQWMGYSRAERERRLDCRILTVMLRETWRAMAQLCSQAPGSHIHLTQPLQLMRWDLGTEHVLIVRVPRGVVVGTPRHIQKDSHQEEHHTPERAFGLSSWKKNPRATELEAMEEQLLRWASLEQMFFNLSHIRGKK